MTITAEFKKCLFKSISVFGSNEDMGWIRVSGSARDDAKFCGSELQDPRSLSSTLPVYGWQLMSFHESRMMRTWFDKMHAYHPSRQSQVWHIKDQGIRGDQRDHRVANQVDILCFELLLKPSSERSFPIPSFSRISNTLTEPKIREGTDQSEVSLS